MEPSVYSLIDWAIAVTALWLLQRLFLQFLSDSWSNTLMLYWESFEVFNYLLIWLRNLEWMICSLIVWRFLVNNNAKFLLQSYVAYINIKCQSQTYLYDTFWCFIPLSIHYNCDEKSDLRSLQNFSLCVLQKVVQVWNGMMKVLILKWTSP